MRTKKPILIVLFLFTWSIISYLLLIRQTDSTPNRYASNKYIANHRQHNEILQQLDRLEANIQEENVLHDELVKKLLEIVKLNDQQIHVGEQDAVVFDKYTVIDPNAIGDNKNSKIDAHMDNSKLHNDAKKTGDNDGSPLDFDNAISSNDDDNQKHLMYRLQQLNKRNNDFDGPIIPVLVFACNRPSVRNCLDNLIEYRPNANQFPIIVSQVSPNI